MANSKSKLFIFAFVVINLVGCISSTVKTKKQGGAYEFISSRERIITQCERVEKDDGEVAYGFFVHLLTNEKKVISLWYPLLMTEDGCIKSEKKAHRIIKHGKSIYLAGRGDLEGIDKTNEYKYEFPGKGVFPGSRSFMEFFAIANEKGDCFSPLNEPEKKCLSYPFPLK